MTFDNIEIEKCKFYYSKYQFTQIMYISDKVMMSDKVSWGKKKLYTLLFERQWKSYKVKWNVWCFQK